MNYVKKTKKYNVYEVKIEHIGEFIIKDPRYYEGKYKLNKDTQSMEGFSIVKFENKDTGCVSQCECYQTDTLNDIKNDIERIKSYQISGTKFYSNWMKMLFEQGKTYDLMINGVELKGTFYGQDTFRKKTFYFNINGEKVKAEGLSFNGYRL